MRADLRITSISERISMCVCGSFHARTRLSCQLICEKEHSFSENGAAPTTKMHRTNWQRTKSLPAVSTLVPSNRCSTIRVNAIAYPPQRHSRRHELLKVLPVDVQ